MDKETARRVVRMLAEGGSFDAALAVMPEAVRQDYVAFVAFAYAVINELLGEFREAPRTPTPNIPKSKEDK